MTTTLDQEFVKINEEIWKPLWFNMPAIPVSEQELDALFKLAERSKLPMKRFETILDAKGKKTIRMRKLKERIHEVSTYDYFFIPVHFKGSVIYSNQFCRKKNKRVDLDRDALVNFIKETTGIRPSTKLLKDGKEELNG